MTDRMTRRPHARRVIRFDARWLTLALMLLSAAITLAAGWLIWVAVALAVTV